MTRFDSTSPRSGSSSWFTTTLPIRRERNAPLVPLSCAVKGYLQRGE